MNWWWGMWREWCESHPATLLYLLFVSTLNLALSLVEVVK